MVKQIDGFFEITERNSNFKREIIGGITTFMTMAYIIIVNPIILSPAFTAGLVGDEKAIMLRAMVCATCLGAACATFLMGILAKYPIDRTCSGNGAQCNLYLYYLPADESSLADCTWYGLHQWIDFLDSLGGQNS